MPRASFPEPLIVSTLLAELPSEACFRIAPHSEVFFLYSIPDRVLEIMQPPLMIAVKGPVARSAKAKGLVDKNGTFSKFSWLLPFISTCSNRRRILITEKASRW
jgi:hypothetical protein